MFAIYWYIYDYQREHFRKVVSKQIKSKFVDDIYQVRTFRKDDDSIACSCRTQEPSIFTSLADFLLEIFPNAVIYLKDLDSCHPYMLRRSIDENACVVPKITRKFAFIDDKDDD